MRLTTRRFHNILDNQWVHFLGAIASVLALAFEIRHLLSNSVLNAKQLWLLGLSLPLFLLFIAASFYSFRVRQDNQAFRSAVKLVHRINHEYRDSLSATFGTTQAPDSATQFSVLASIEKRVIKSMCEKIARIYTGFTHRDCIVTVGLLQQIGDKETCEMYVRSEETCQRDGRTRKQFELNTGKNTALDRALQYTDLLISFFHSADLTKEGDYRSERDRWDQWYKSVIVVPIRSVDPGRLGSKDFADNIGFLIVDTLAVNRLNNGWHVELLAAFADQLYNFMSLMRGKYIFPKSNAPVQ